MIPTYNPTRAVKVLRWRILAWILILTLAAYTSLSYGVERAFGSAQPGTQSVQMNATCGSWVYWSGETTANNYSQGMTIVPRVHIDWTVKRNGCGILPSYIRCYATTVLISYRSDWCGFWQPSYAASYIDVGNNWTECSSPIPGVGLCNGNYQRQRLYADGGRSAPWPNMI